MSILSYVKDEIQVIRERDPCDQIEYGSISLSEF